MIQSTPLMKACMCLGACVDVYLDKTPLDTEGLLANQGLGIVSRDPGVFGGEKYDLVLENWLSSCPPNVVSRHFTKMDDPIRADRSEAQGNLDMLRGHWVDAIPPAFCSSSEGTAIKSGVGKVVGLHLGGKVNGPWPLKRWNPESWGRMLVGLGDLFQRRGWAMTVIVFGTKSDDIPAFGGLLWNDLRGDKPLADVAAAIGASCDLFISHDSGLAHVAAALKIPTLVLFGPTSIKKNLPPYYAVAMQQNAELLECQPCQVEGWRECGHECMKKLRPSEVAEKAFSLIENQP